MGGGSGTAVVVGDLGHGGGGDVHANEITCSVTSLWAFIVIQKAFSGDCLCEGTTGQEVGLVLKRMVLNYFMSKGTDLSACKSQSILSFCSSLFERMQVGSIRKPVVNGPTPGCRLWSFTAKTLLSLAGKHLAPHVKGRICEADIQTLSRLGRKGRDRNNKQETERGKEKRRNNEPAPNHSSVSKTLW